MSLETAMFYTYSTVAQSLAGVLAVVGAITLFRFGSLQRIRDSFWREYGELVPGYFAEWGKAEGAFKVAAYVMAAVIVTSVAVLAAVPWIAKHMNTAVALLAAAPLMMAGCLALVIRAILRV